MFIDKREPSPQMTRLMVSYGVATERELVRAIAREYAVETGVTTTLRDAAVILDQMLEATYQRMASGGDDEPDFESVPERCSCPARIYGGDCAHTIDEEYEARGF